MLSKHLFRLYSYGHKAKGRHSSAVGGLAIALEEAISKMYCDQFLNQLAIAKQRGHQTAFISYALGGRRQYTGRSMETAHEGLNLEPEHFDAIAKHLGEALAVHGVSQEDLKTVVAHVSTLKESVLHK
jgi:hemoglobin